MTKVKIIPGPCGNVTHVEAVAGKRVKRKIPCTVKIETACPNIRRMAETLELEFDAYELCLRKPGTGPLFDYARENFPVHVSCPAINGIIKAVEAECGLALKHNASIEFEE